MPMVVGFTWVQWFWAIATGAVLLGWLLWIIHHGRGGGGGGGWSGGGDAGGGFDVGDFAIADGGGDAGGCGGD